MLKNMGCRMISLGMDKEWNESDNIEALSGGIVGPEISELHTWIFSSIQVHWHL